MPHPTGFRWVGIFLITFRDFRVSHPNLPGRFPASADAADDTQPAVAAEFSVAKAQSLAVDAPRQSGQPFVAAEPPCSKPLLPAAVQPPCFPILEPYPDSKP